MMKPRALVPFVTLCSSTPTLEQTIHELQTELRQTQNKLSEESRKRAMAEADAARLRRNMDKPPAIPTGDEVFGYECGAPGCACTLKEDYVYCPECGTEIDWRTSWVDPRYSYKRGTYEQDVKAIIANGRASGQIHR